MAPSYLEVGASGKSGAVQRPAWLSLPTAYPAQLRSYSSSGLLVLASRTDDCAKTSGKAFIPAIVGRLHPDAPLLAFVNVSQGRTTAWLERDGELSTDRITCNEPSGGARVTYSTVCSFERTSNIVPGEYELVVAIRSLTGGTIQESYRISLD